MSLHLSLPPIGIRHHGWYISYFLAFTTIRLLTVYSTGLNGLPRSKKHELCTFCHRHFVKARWTRQNWQKECFLYFRDNPRKKSHCVSYLLRARTLRMEAKLWIQCRRLSTNFADVIWTWPMIQPITGYHRCKSHVKLWLVQFKWLFYIFIVTQPRLINSNTIMCKCKVQ